jgi:serine/threonine-protein kinase HipA
VDDPLVVWLGDAVVGELRAFGRRSAQFYPARARIGLAAGAQDDASPWPADFTRAWFENLLPEEEPRARIAARFGLRSDDTWELLERIGWECAGAVAVLPRDRTPQSGSYQTLTSEEMWERIDALPARPYDSDAAIRMSLGGGQSKILLARRDDRWHLPIGGAPSTHILKPEPAYYPGLAVAEAWALRVASAATPVAEARVMTDEGHAPTLVVTRFDRVAAADGVVRRTHQEDMCQILGIPPELKYAEHPMNDRHPSYARFAAVIERRAIEPAVELVRLLEHVTVNLALGNSDAHAKNTSVLHVSGGLRVSPMYDVAPTTAFINQRHFGLAVASKFLIAEMTREHLVREAHLWGVPERVARAAIDRTMDAMKTAGVPAADRAYPAIRPDVRATALEQLERLSRS